jgi:hypothetical protein
MSDEQNVLLIPWAYIQACVTIHPDDVEIKFRHVTVLAPDEAGAYLLGQRSLPVEGWITNRGTINDYVIPDYGQAFTLEGSVQTTDRRVLKLRPKTSAQERRSSESTSQSYETEGNSGSS